MWITYDVGSKAVHRPGPHRQPAQKEVKKKRTLKEVASSMLSDMAERAREERMRPLVEMQRAQEEEVAVLLFGPGWRDGPPERDSDADEELDETG